MHRLAQGLLHVHRLAQGLLHVHRLAHWLLHGHCLTHRLLHRTRLSLESVHRTLLIHSAVHRLLPGTLLVRVGLSHLSEGWIGLSTCHGTVIELLLLHHTQSLSLVSRYFLLKLIGSRRLHRFWMELCLI